MALGLVLVGLNCMTEMKDAMKFITQLAFVVMILLFIRIAWVLTF